MKKSAQKQDVDVTIAKKEMEKEKVMKRKKKQVKNQIKVIHKNLEEMDKSSVEAVDLVEMVRGVEEEKEDAEEDAEAVMDKKIRKILMAAKDRTGITRVDTILGKTKMQVKVNRTAILDLLVQKRVISSKMELKSTSLET